jgi:hypothetical protein
VPRPVVRAQKGTERKALSSGYRSEPALDINEAAAVQIAAQSPSDKSPTRIKYSPVSSRL